MRRSILLICGFTAAVVSLWLLFVQVFPSEEELRLQLEPAVALEREDWGFPVHISGTTLIAEKIVSYEGWHAEGDIGFETTDTAALLLYNYGAENIANAQVVLKVGAVEMVFVLDTLPAGERVLVPEQTGKGYGATVFHEYSGWQTVDYGDWDCALQLQFGFPDIGTITVTNRTDRTLCGITLHYKNYLPEASFYVGGRTNLHYIERIEPGDTICIYPLNYAYGYSKILRIQLGNI